jgi:hypothetical protein
MLSKITQLLFKSIHKNRSKKDWKEYEYFDKRWKNRIEHMSRLIDDERSFLDLGCGKMWLKEFLPKDGVYYGSDYKVRDENTIVCDFNNGQFPDITVDCCFASGVLEYINDLDNFFRQVYKTSRSFIFSYCPVEMQSDITFRMSLGWRNHFSRSTILEYLKNNKFIPSKESVNVDGYDIYKFINQA